MVAAKYTLFLKKARPPKKRNKGMNITEKLIHLAGAPPKALAKEWKNNISNF